MTHKHIFAPDAVCLEPFGKRYGFSKAEWQKDNALAKYLMDEYARDRGYLPDDSWYLVVHPDGKSDYHTIDESSAGSFPCCSGKESIVEMLDSEAEVRGEPKIVRRISE